MKSPPRVTRVTTADTPTRDERENPAVVEAEHGDTESEMDSERGNPDAEGQDLGEPPAIDFVVEEMSIGTHFEAARVAIADTLGLKTDKLMKPRGIRTALSKAEPEMARETLATLLPASTCVRRALETVNGQVRGEPEFQCTPRYHHEELLAQAASPLPATAFVPVASDHGARQRGKMFTPYDVAIASTDKENNGMAMIDNDIRLALSGFSFLENSVAAVVDEVRQGDANEDMGSAIRLTALMEVPMSTVFAQATYHLGRALANVSLLRRDAKKQDSAEVSKRLRCMPVELQDLSGITPKVLESCAKNRQDAVFSKQVLNLAAAGSRKPLQHRKGRGFEKSRRAQTTGAPPAAAEKPQGDKQDGGTYGAYLQKKNRGGSSGGRGGSRGRGRGRGAGTVVKATPTSKQSF